MLLRQLKEKKSFTYVRDHRPKTFKWIILCYGEQSALDCEDHSHDSPCGVQEGDTYALHCFLWICLRLRVALKSTPEISMIWYCNDGTLLGIHQGFKKLNKYDKHMVTNMVLNMKKSDWFWPNSIKGGSFHLQMKRVLSWCLATRF